MKTPSTLKELRDDFLKLEADLDLFNPEKSNMAGVCVWRLLRYDLYQKFVVDLGIAGVAHPKPSNVPGPFKKALQMMGNAVFFSPFNQGQKDHVLIPAERKVVRDDILTDVYTHDLWHQLPLGERLMIDLPWHSRYLTGAGGDICRADGVLLRGWFNKICNKVHFSEEEQAFLKQLAQEVQTRFGTKTDIAQMGENMVRRFLANRSVYLKLFKKLAPKKVYIVFPIGREAIIDAAKASGAKVYELQHGLISPYHLAYHYPGDQPIPYMPDHILCFGEYWAEAADLPQGMTTSIMGTMHMPGLLEKPDIQKKKSQVLFVSQGPIGEKLFAYATHLAKERPDMVIDYRLHPSENVELYEQWKKEAGSPANILITGKEKPLKNALAEAGVQVGVYSTVLFEGMLMDCRTLVVDMPMTEHLEPAFDSGDMILVKTPEDLVQKLDDAPKAKNPSRYFDTPVKNLPKLIEEL